MNYLLIVDDTAINMATVNTIHFREGSTQVDIYTDKGPIFFKGNQGLRVLNWLTTHHHKEILRNNTIVHVIL